MSKIYGILLRKPQNIEHNYLVATGNPSAIAKLKDVLTIRNDGVGFKLNMFQKDLRLWESKRSLYAIEKCDKLRQEIKKLEGEAVVEYFEETEEGVIIPAGYWFLGEKVEGDIHLNTNLKPVHLPGMRDYQIEAIDATLINKRATCVLGTGGGKTMIIASLCMSAINAGKRVCVVVPTEYLINQVINTLKRYTDSVTGASAKRIPKLGTDVMVFTAITAQKHIDKFDMVVLDECHHNVAESLENLLSSARAEYVYNLTATPFRSDGMDFAIFSFGGPVVFERDVRWLVEKGWLCPFDAYVVYTDTYANVAPGTKTVFAYKACINKHFIQVVYEHAVKAIAKDRKIICLFKTVKTARSLGKLLNVDVADGNFKKPLHDFQAGNTKVLIATDRLVSEGVDIPDADILMLCTQNSSEIITRQSLGRILRKSEGKKQPIVLDFVAKGCRSFDTAATKRKKVWKSLASNYKELGER